MVKLNIKDYTWQVILNPNAGDNRCFDNWDLISKKLDEWNVPYCMHKADERLKGSQTAKQLCQDGCRHFIVIGGDGTINEVIDGIFSAGINTREVFLSVMPLGRGNDWARTHKFSQVVEDNLSTLMQGNFTSHDVGLVRSYQGEKIVQQRHFINICGFCFDAEVIYTATYKKPHFLGMSVYVLSLIKTLLGYKSQHVKVKMDDKTYDDKSFLTVAAICKYNGGGMCQAPMADYQDGLFDVVIVPKVSALRVMCNVKRLFTGTHIQKIKKIKTYKTKELQIESDATLRCEVEGELLEPGNYNLSIIPNSINTLTNSNLS